MSKQQTTKTYELTLEESLVIDLYRGMNVDDPNRARKSKKGLRTFLFSDDEDEEGETGKKAERHPNLPDHFYRPRANEEGRKNKQEATRGGGLGGARQQALRAAARASRGTNEAYEPRSYEEADALRQEFHFCQNFGQLETKTLRKDGKVILGAKVIPGTNYTQ